MKIFFKDIKNKLIHKEIHLRVYNKIKQTKIHLFRDNKKDSLKRNKKIQRAKKKKNKYQ